MAHLTFKQYLESREQLLKAIENTPIVIREYDIRKYCSLCIGETVEEKELVSLKPRHSLIVEWQYDDINDPTPMSIKFKNVDGYDDQSYSTFWNGNKLNKWLIRHALPGVEINYK